MNPNTRRGIFTVALFFLALLALLSMFGVAGSFGTAVDGFISHIFGWDKLFVPMFLFAWGYHVANPEKFPLNASNFIGFILFFVGLNGLVHAVTFPDAATVTDAALLSQAGGSIGQLIARPGISFLGFAGATALFAALFVASILMIFNTSIQSIFSFFAFIGRMLAKLFMLIVRFFSWMFRARPRKVEEVDVSDGYQEEDDPPSPSDALGLRGTAEHGVGDAVATNHSAMGSASHINEVAPPRVKKRRPKIQVPLDLLLRRDDRPTSGDIEFNKEVIRKTLMHFGIDVEMGDVAVGPTVTQFTFKPAEGVKLARVTALHNDLALALAAHPIRIEAPIPGKSLVGVEVPNKNVALVGMREMLESRVFQEKEKRFAIPFPLGKDVSGYPIVVDLSRMPHMLVAGATGSGKSVCLNILITSLLFNHSPDDLKLILVDPKRVEFPVYNGIPHLITPVITKSEDTVNALKWTIREMDRRFDALAAAGARDIFAYNERSKDKLPYIVFIVDELADLMVTSGAEVEGPIVRIAQLARAVGIHLVLATQRPSVDVLTGLIKANIPARFAFSVASSTDSRTILDQPGADKLLGRGDMLYQTSEMSAPKRVQCAFLSDDEVRRVVEFLKSSYGPTEYEEGVTKRNQSQTMFGSNGNDEDSDPLLEAAMEEIIRAGKASASLLQRRLKVGYARAARLLDLLEQEGMIGPGDGAKPREVLRTDFGGSGSGGTYIAKGARSEERGASIPAPTQPIAPTPVAYHDPPSLSKTRATGDMEDNEEDTDIEELENKEDTLDSSIDNEYLGDKDDEVS